MPQELYSVEQVAELLGLHVRTVRGYVRDGKLKAVRIGKQYRIAREDLEALTGQPAAEPDAGRGHRAEVSTIVEIEDISRDGASRVANTLIAATRGPRDENTPLRVETMYNEERARMKVVVLGGLETTAALLSLISTLVEADT